MINNINSTTQNYSKQKSFGLGQSGIVAGELMRTKKMNFMFEMLPLVRPIEDAKGIEFTFFRDKKMNKENPGFFIKCISHPKISKNDDETIFTYALKMLKYSIKNQIGKSKSINLNSVDKNSQLMELIQESERDLAKKMKSKKAF